MRSLPLTVAALFLASAVAAQDPASASAPAVDPHALPAATAPAVDPHAMPAATAPATDVHHTSLAEQVAEPVGDAAAHAAVDVLAVPGAEPVAPADAHAPHGDAAHAATSHGGDAHGADDHGAHGESHALIKPAQIFNFVVFFGVLAFLLGKPLAGFLRQRRAAIADSLAAADQAEREAKAKLAAMEARLQALDGEVNGILDAARQQAAAEKALLLERAQADANRVLAQAGAQVGEMEQAAARRLRTVAAELAVDMAREIVEKQMGPDDRRRVFDRALKGLQKTGSQN